MLPLGLIAQEAPLDPLDDACGAGDPKPWLCRLVFETTDSADAGEVARVLTPWVSVALIVVGAFLANRVLRRVVRRVMGRWERVGHVTVRGRRVLKLIEATSPTPTVRRHNRAQTIAAGLSSVATIVVAFVAVALVLGALGIRASTVLTSAGLLGVALGFGAQNLLRDLIAGTFMIFEDQLGVGDVVDVGEAAGVVEDVSLRTTRLRDVNGVVWHVPNGEIKRVGNMSQEWSRALLDVAVSYQTDVDLAEGEIKRVADEVWHDPELGPLVISEPEVWGVEQLGADGMVIRLVVQTRPLEQWRIARELRARIKRRFDELGIEIPLPQRTVWHRGDFTAVAHPPGDARHPDGE
jgi:small conductance mechanosensitive channel